jgi:hypothetical protein
MDNVALIYMWTCIAALAIIVLAAAVCAAHG